MFHEDFVPATNWKNAVMTTWQRAQFWTLGRLADVAGFSIQTWATRYQSWFPNTDVAHWHVGSNIPHVGVSCATARDQLGINTSTFVAGIFGSLRSSRMMDWIRYATHALAHQAEDFTLLYVGPHGTVLKEALPDVRIRNAGPLPAEEVSIHLSAMDLHLAPFIDGVSTRRGSFLAGLQHGVPTVSTQGPLTDSMLEDENGNAFMLVPVDAPDGFKQVAIVLQTNPKRRQAMREQSQLFFERHFKWSLVADEILSSLNSAST
jgi:glycosyltransferase involved in cell wall biosynthesis